MNRSGCKNCPVKPCVALYRGSICASRRHKFGLGDPMTNADRIRAMTDKELLGFLMHVQYVAIKRYEEFKPQNYNALADWLQQTAEEDDNA